MYFWKSNICHHQLDVQETNLSYTQFNKIKIISLDARLGPDGIPALDLWDLIFAVLGNANQSHDRTAKPVDTSVSHSSTEFEIISLDAVLRMDGLPALDLWDVVIEVSRDRKPSEQ